MANVSDNNDSWPENLPKFSAYGIKEINICKLIDRPASLTINHLIENSNAFPAKFPIDTCRIPPKVSDRWENIEKQAASVYPIIHERVLWLYIRYLEHMKKYGNNIQKPIYENMNIIDFVQRLLTKRCVAFYGRQDKYLLTNGEKGSNGFTEIGTPNEKYPISLNNCLSYDEIKLSALLSISSYSDFLNNGTRRNCGVIEMDKTKIETEGIIIGIIGARFEQPLQMEYQDIVISAKQNIPTNGYGFTTLDVIDDSSNDFKNRVHDYRNIWNEFYADNCSQLFDDVKIDGLRYVPSKRKNDIFDCKIMKKRYTISFDTLLLEADSRAASAKRMAYIHVVGIGLGVWRATKNQETIFLETFAERIMALLSKLQHIGWIHFSWFHTTECGILKNGAVLRYSDHENGITVLLSNRNPADKLIGCEFENSLLVVSYAWDGNAQPGNEFWYGLLDTTGDPAAACSTLITELHNGHINKSMVSGENLHIATEKMSVVHVSEYAEYLLKEIS